MREWCAVAKGDATMRLQVRNNYILRKQDATSIFFLLPFIGLLEAIGCPGGIWPCECSGQYYVQIVCKNILRPEELIPPMKAVEMYKTEVFKLTIKYSSMLYFPDNIFKNTNIQQVEISDSNIMSLSESDTAFDGLEEILRVLKAKDLKLLSVWDFEQIRNLKNLRMIEFSGTLVGSVVHQFPQLPKLGILKLNSGEISHLNDDAFSHLPELEIFELKGNAITEMKRSMLPNPANHVYNINLSGNMLSYLPKDFFKNMPKLTHVYLDENKFRTLSENPFSEALGKTAMLSLEGNSIHCDCRLHWLVNKRYPDFFLAECSTPKFLARKHLKRLDYKSLWCL